jgi:hypothetical protein
MSRSEALFAPLGISMGMSVTAMVRSRRRGLRLALAMPDRQLVLNPALGKASGCPGSLIAVDHAKTSGHRLFRRAIFLRLPWWLGRTLSGDKEVTWVAGMGLGGQRLVMVPDLDLIMMTTSGAYGSSRQGNAALDILYRFVMPAVRVQ